MAKKPIMCTKPVVYLPDDDCSECMIEVNKLRREVEECCDEVKGTLRILDGRITTNEGDIANIRQSLANYYTKAETYNKTEVDALLDAIETGEFVIVQSLPATGDPKNIYLVPKTGGGYTEHIYLQGIGWEQIGDTEVDLSNYYTKTQTDSLLNNKQNKLTAGTNITITGNTISAADPKWNSVELQRVRDDTSKFYVPKVETLSSATAKYNTATNENVGNSLVTRDADGVSRFGGVLFDGVNDRKVGVWPTTNQGVVNNNLDVGWAYDNYDGALLGLRSADTAEPYDGSFLLRARANGKECYLDGRTNQELLWGEKPVLTVEPNSYLKTVGTINYTSSTTWRKIGTISIPHVGLYRFKALYSNAAVLGLAFSSTSATDIYQAVILADNTTGGAIDVVVPVDVTGNVAIWTKCGTAGRSNNFEAYSWIVPVRRTDIEGS